MISDLQCIVETYKLSTARLWKLVQITTNVIMRNRKIYSLLVYSVKYAIIMLLTFITYRYYDKNHYGICAFFRRNEKICSHVYT